MNLKITKIIEETHNVKTIFFEDADEGGRQFDFKAGQYLTFRFDQFEGTPVRSYTISSSPRQEDSFAITVKEGPGIGAWFCKEAQVGMVLRARGPMGSFCYDGTSKAIVLIGAGVGVTPLMSIMRDLSALGEQAPAVQLVYTYRNLEDKIFASDMHTMPFGVYHNVSSIDQRLTKDTLRTAIVNPSRPLCPFGQYLICGSKAFAATIQEYLVELGADPSTIKIEAFG